ncbi:hypothetical protein [Mesorhizobium sp. M1B.F.Ca.ET.045.04.1.1]|uniref:hypothetical protein n=1 Tax=Mesorhizobium sp. M1B.F.Ca.ET.045.04.1.1 TaxID=2493673 RepID=UPI000F75C19C|nr:hypothetical protein [Mesorhizobium sp. M1B.F.Ca.ET.045.04.1.1]AZO32368.1 hypothetical protein EJ071_36840 [Mesorhizobium sp. M1B.F.Ca.ET.045.04.1.1]
MIVNRLQDIENRGRNDYLNCRKRGAVFNNIPDFITTRAQADAVIEAFFQSGDLDVFSRHRQAMIDDSHRGSLAIMRGSGNELGPFEEFLSALEKHGVVTMDEAFTIGDRYIAYKRSKAA